MNNEKKDQKPEVVKANAQCVVNEFAVSPAVGHVKLIMRNVETGEETVIVDRHNVITHNFYIELKEILAGASTNVIRNIAFGTDTTPRTAEDPTNTTITGPVTVLATHTYPDILYDDNSVEFTGTLGPTDSNGMAIQELGLFFASGTLLAARIALVGVVTKDPHFSLTVVWRITWPAPVGGALNAIRGCLARLISLHTTPGDHVESIQFGTGSMAPDPAQTGLQLAISPVKAVTSVTYPDAYSVRFLSYLSSFEGNGFTISEAGLLTAAGTLIAREIFAGRYKDAEHLLEFGITIRLHT